MDRVNTLPVPGAARTAPPKIPVADDCPDNAAPLGVRLRGEGCACLTAFDGEEALRRAAAHYRAGPRPDTVSLRIDRPPTSR